MTILIVVEHDNTSPLPAFYSILTAALQLQQPIDVLVAGQHCDEVAKHLTTVANIAQVRLADHACYAYALAENMAGLIQSLSGDYQYILAPATTFGKNILPRVAACLDVAQVSDVIAIVNADTVVHPIYAGNAYETVRMLDPIRVMTIRASQFMPTHTVREGSPLSIEALTFICDKHTSTFVKMECHRSERPDLATARVIVAGGRGLQSAENFALLEQLAAQLHAALGASRAAVDAGFVPNEFQVGQTGKIVAPELYIAVGISGAIQHVAGMKDSKIVVAINKDANAPIFRVADYGLVGDLFQIIPELCDALR